MSYRKNTYVTHKQKKGMKMPTREVKKLQKRPPPKHYYIYRILRISFISGASGGAHGPL